MEIKVNKYNNIYNNLLTNLSSNEEEIDNREGLGRCKIIIHEKFISFKK